MRPGSERGRRVSRAPAAPRSTVSSGHSRTASSAASAGTRSRGASSRGPSPTRGKRSRHRLAQLTDDDDDDNPPSDSSSDSEESARRRNSKRSRKRAYVPIVVGQRLRASDTYEIPEFARKIVVDENLRRHLSFVYLTNEACKAAALTTKSKSVLAVSSAGKVVSTRDDEAAGLARDERALSIQDWRTAYPRLLVLLALSDRKREAPLFRALFDEIQDRPDLAERWRLYLRYDIEMRRGASKGADPSVWNPEIFSLYEAEFNADSAASRWQPPAAPAAGGSRSFRADAPRTSKDSRDYRPRSDDRPRTENNGNYACYVCGQTTHRGRGCTATTALWLVRSADNKRWVTPIALNNFCAIFNTNSPCGKTKTANGRACTGGEHQCSLCGNYAHGANECARRA